MFASCSSTRKALTEERLAEAVRVDMEESNRLAIYDLATAMQLCRDNKSSEYLHRSWELIYHVLSYNHEPMKRNFPFTLTV